jgi:single-strand DNA-binding protein
MARSFNQVVLMGNLTRDPELRQTPGGNSVCSFSLALNRSYKAADGNWQEAVDYIDVVAWGPLGERVAQYMTKGRPCLVSGRLQSRSWEQDGQKRNKVEVNASDVTFLGGPGDGGSSSAGGGYGADDNDQGSSNSSNNGSNGGGKPAPTKKPQKDDVQIDDLSEEPINLDDIPF